MRKSLILLAALASAALLSTPAFAAKQSAVLAACKRTPGCWSQNLGNGRVSGCSPNACFDCFNGSCRRSVITAGGSKVQRGPNSVVTPTKSSRGSIPIQTGPNVVINPTTRPTGPGPCTVHCGPLGGRGKR